MCWRQPASVFTVACGLALTETTSSALPGAGCAAGSLVCPDWFERKGGTPLVCVSRIQVGRAESVSAGVGMEEAAVGPRGPSVGARGPESCSTCCLCSHWFHAFGRETVSFFPRPRGSGQREFPWPSRQTPAPLLPAVDDARQGSGPGQPALQVPASKAGPTVRGREFGQSAPPGHVQVFGEVRGSRGA